MRLVAFLFAVCGLLAPAADYPWLNTAVERPLARAIDPPAGFHRVAVPATRFRARLRGLPLRACRVSLRGWTRCRHSLSLHERGSGRVERLVGRTAADRAGQSRVVASDGAG